jgi:chorismate--pyruvate lyase
MLMRNGQTVRIPEITDPGLHWKSFHQCIPRPSPEYRRWLLDSGSLSQILRQRSGGDFAVLLNEEVWWRGRSAYLCRLLGKQLSAQRFWSRKVVLTGNTEPWVVAHTLVPQQSLGGRLSQVKRLQTKPLGAFLFRQSGLRRAGLDIVETDLGWGRCSLFEFDRHPILVAEFFLPALIYGNP